MMVRSDLPVRGAEYAGEPEVARLGLAPFAAVVCGALAMAALVLWICFPPPGPATLSWNGLALFAAIYISASIAMYLAALGTLCWLLGNYVALTFREIAWKSWAAVGWMPLWTLAGHERSPWVTGVSMVVAALTMVSLRELVGDRAQERELVDQGERALFGAGDGLVAGEGQGAIRWAVLVAVALQCGLVLFLLERYLLAGVWLAAALAYLCWELGRRRRVVRSEAMEEARASAGWAMKTAVPVMLTACALVPFSKNAALAGAFADWLGFRVHVPLPVVTEVLPHGRNFSGIILVPAAKEKKVEAPVLKPALITAGKPEMKPVEIDFSGVYWYFEQAYDRPLSDAPMVHGDASRNTVRSTNEVPLAMMANQSLSAPMEMDCCSQIRVAILSREGTRLGPITMEMVLRDSTVKGEAGSLSLGSEVVESSAQDRGDAVEEVLRYSVPKNAGLRRFDAISVRIQPVDVRVVRGAHIAIEKFVLVP